MPIKQPNYVVEPTILCFYNQIEENFIAEDDIKFLHIALFLITINDLLSC